MELEFAVQLRILHGVLPQQRDQGLAVQGVQVDAEPDVLLIVLAQERVVERSRGRGGLTVQQGQAEADAVLAEQAASPTGQSQAPDSSVPSWVRRTV